MTASPSRRQFLAAASGFAIFPALLSGKLLRTNASDSAIPSLYKSLADYFPVGAAVRPDDLVPPHSDLLTSQFNSVVAENAMKWRALRPSEDAFNFSAADAIVNFANAHHMLIRGHNLVWHVNNPRWLFKDAAGDDLKPIAESKSLVLRRLETHIRTVVSRYRDDVYAWDVVNEVVDPKQPDGFRRSDWFRFTGTDYIDTAFRVAREVAPRAKLFVNDYETTNPAKRDFLLRLVQDLKSRGVPVDAMGHQTHINLESPTVDSIVESIEKFSALGLDNQITELDVSVYTNPIDSCDAIPEAVLAEQGYRYRDLFNAFRSLKGKISGVTLWGYADDHTWLRRFPRNRLDDPLLFDERLLPKPAFWGIVDPSRLAPRSSISVPADFNSCSSGKQ
ncbi:MAG TPA: endo-1,4-beta-xylanase [Candidatus Acidoferrales bacterium]|nr:endo-1,4-beta-xylanase [Candidatus Acidoferrales bacterium]